MGIGVSILVGIASSAAFFLIQKYFLQWPFPWDLAATLAVLTLATAASFFLARGVVGQGPRRTEVMTDIETKNNMQAKIDGLETEEPPSKVMSGLKSGGDGKFEIRNTKI